MPHDQNLSAEVIALRAEVVALRTIVMAAVPGILAVGMSADAVKSIISVFEKTALDGIDSACIEADGPKDAAAMRLEEEVRQQVRGKVEEFFAGMIREGGCAPHMFRLQ